MKSGVAPFSFSERHVVKGARLCGWHGRTDESCRWEVVGGLVVEVDGRRHEWHRLVELVIRASRQVCH